MYLILCLAFFIQFQFVGTNWVAESILIILRFCVCKFTHSLKFICNSKSILGELQGTFMVSHGHEQGREKCESQAGMFSAKIEQGDALPSGFSML